MENKEDLLNGIGYDFDDISKYTNSIEQRVKSIREALSKSKELEPEPIAMTGQCPYCRIDFKFWISDYMYLHGMEQVAERECSGCGESYKYWVAVPTMRIGRK